MVFQTVGFKLGSTKSLHNFIIFHKIIINFFAAEEFPVNRTDKVERLERSQSEIVTEPLQHQVGGDYVSQRSVASAPAETTRTRWETKGDTTKQILLACEQEVDQVASSQEKIQDIPQDIRITTTTAPTITSADNAINREQNVDWQKLAYLNKILNNVKCI